MKDFVLGLIILVVIIVVVYGAGAFLEGLIS
jgi:hypothetical protein